MNGFVDLQVNGAFGIDFNGDSLSPEQLHDACSKLSELGVSQFLPTVITDSVDKIVGRFERLVEGRRQSSLAQQMIPGFHVEGPFLSSVKGFVGAHPIAETRDVDLASLERISEACDGLLKLVTLAPERDPGCRGVRWCVDRGIRVSAGHTDASLQQLESAIDEGLSGFTHLGNATPPQLPRHDNIIQRALFLRNRLTIMVIADGHHLPVFVLRNMLDLVGTEQTVVVTDCISAAGLGPGRFQLGNQSVQVSEDLACRSADGTHFVGSAATMPMMDGILKELHYDEETRRQLLCSNPARYMGWKS